MVEMVKKGRWVAIFLLFAVALASAAQEAPPPGHVGITIVPDGEGTVVPDPEGIVYLGIHWYAPGTTVALTADAADGWWITRWTVEERPEGGDWAVVDEISVDPPADTDTIEITTREGVDVRVTAHFQRYWTLTVNVDPVDDSEFFAHGDVRVNGEIPASYPATYQFLEGTPVDLEAVPNATWDFVEWTGDLTGTDPEGSVVMDEDKEVTAHFSIHLYTLEIHVDGCGKVDVDGVIPEEYPASFTYHYMEEAQLEALPCVGWHFSGWSSDLEGEENPTSIVMDSDKTVVASFSRDQYTLTVNIEGQGSVTVDPDQPTYIYGDVVALHAEPAVGWYFDHWVGDVADPNSPDTTITMDGHKTVTAVFLPYEYTLTINIVGEGSVQVFPEQETYHYGDTVQLTAIPADCYKFVGWDGAVTGLDNPVELTITGDTAVTATFEKIVYTLNVNVDPEDAGMVEVSPDDLDPDTPGYQFYCGTEVTLTAQAPIGGCYYFDHWSGGVSDGDATVSFVITSDMDVTAHFEKFTYTLTVDIDPETGGEVLVNGEAPPSYPFTYTFECGEEVTLQAVPAGCYEFAGWSGDAEGTDATVTVYMNGPKTVVADFELLYYTLTVNVEGEGDVAVNGEVPAAYPAEISFPCGTEVTLEALPASGWEFQEWQGDLTGTASEATLLIDGDKSVTAVFRLAAIWVETDLPGGWNLVSIPVQPVFVDCPTYGWMDAEVVIDITGSGGSQLIFGVKPGADDCFDNANDIPAPPLGFPPYTAAGFDTCGITDLLRKDIKAPIACGASKEWSFQINDNGDATEVSLSWDAAAFSFDPDCAGTVILRDEVTGTEVDMLTQRGYTYTKRTNPEVRTFTIRVSTACASGAVFGDDVSPLALYRWQPCIPGYDPVDDAAVVPEKGYWLWVPPEGATVDVLGYELTEDVTVPLDCAGWHMISAPWPYAREDLLFTDGVETKSWVEAVAAGWIADVLWGYDPTVPAYELIDILDPWHGYWILTYVDGLTLVLRYENALVMGPLAGSALDTGLTLASNELPPPPPPAPTPDLSAIDVVNEPNPVRDVNTTVFKVVGPAAAFVEAMRVRIFDASGRLVYEAEVEGPELVWHTQDLTGAYLANGVYLYRVEVKVAGQWITTEVKKLAIYR